LDTVPVLAGWPVRPVIAIASRPTPPYTYDGFAVYDAPGAQYVWDAAGTRPAWTDATCEWSGFELEHGAPDEQGAIPAARFVCQLDNRTGQWSQWNADGTPGDFGPGQTVNVWAHNASGDWWLFSGTIARWDERGDDTVELEAFDVFSDLAQPIGQFTAGTAGDRPGPRTAAVLAAAGRSTIPTRTATGTVALTVQPSDRAPLEEIQTVVSSDGGLVYVDADGTLVTTDRGWRAGRTDQTAVPVFSDNVCTAPVVVWDPVLSTNDFGLADAVVLTNVAELHAQAPLSLYGAQYVQSFTDQQWTTQAEGDTLAAFLLAQQGQARLAVDEASVYLLDPRQTNLWAVVDWRRGDRLRFVHDVKTASGPARIDVTVVLAALTHTVTPDGWVMSFATSRAVTYTTPAVWDNVQYPWDDPTPTWTY
jgi:hypothetical protein